MTDGDGDRPTTPRPARIVICPYCGEAPLRADRNFSSGAVDRYVVVCRWCRSRVEYVLDGRSRSLEHDGWASTDRTASLGWWRRRVVLPIRRRFLHWEGKVDPA